MELCDEGDDVFSKEVIDEFLIEGYSGGIDRVVTASQRDDTGPGYGESVGFRACSFEEFDVF